MAGESKTVLYSVGLISITLFFSVIRVEFAHAEGAGVMGCSWDDAVVSYDCWFVKYFFASLVGAFEFILMVVAVENLREHIPPYA